MQFFSSAAVVIGAFRIKTCHKDKLLCSQAQNMMINLITDHIFACFVALHPKSTAMVMGGRSVHLTTLFPVQA